MGISIGLVLAFIGVTGAIMGFEDEIMEALSPQARVEMTAPAPLSPDVLLDVLRQQMPKGKITALQVEADPERAYTITVLRRPADGGRNPRIFVDPYDGKLLGEATGAEFFGRVRSLHRYLTASGANNEVGRHITGIAAFAWFNIPGLGIVIGLAMICNLVAGALGGILVPMVLERVRADPAVASGTFVTTITDVVGFFSFLGIATLWFGLK